MRYLPIPLALTWDPATIKLPSFSSCAETIPKIKSLCIVTSAMIAPRDDRRLPHGEQHWTPDQAYNEMRFFHFHTYLILMGHYVKSFPFNFAIDPAFSALRATETPQ